MVPCFVYMFMTQIALLYVNIGKKNFGGKLVAIRQIFYHQSSYSKFVYQLWFDRSNAQSLLQNV